MSSSENESDEEVLNKSAGEEGEEEEETLGLVENKESNKVTIFALQLPVPTRSE
jgi:hypothetical protein